MNDDLVFRICLLVLFVAFVAHRGYYTRKLGDSNKKTIKERKENLVTKLVGLLGLAGLVAVALYIAYPSLLVWAALALPEWVRWVGVGIAVAGFGLLQWAHWALGKNWSDTPRLMQDQQLVTGGPYQWVRHPIYTAFLMIMGATLLISANWFVGGLWIAVTAFEIMSRIQFEEDLMLETFGDAYRAQMQRTGRLLPRFTPLEKTT
jgi:protein-S-isoprenylcysteine O-methyltransferase Ste14